jgi:major membrane immunogen (membrane-anchored lipoprotein)
MRLTLPLLLCLTTVLAACGSSDPKELTDQGSAALGSGDVSTAIERFDAALKHMDAKHPDYVRASMGRCQALVRQNPRQAKDEFLALSRTAQGHIHEQDFSAIAGELVKTGAVTEAVEVMDAGLKAFPESPQMQILKQKVVEASTKSKDPAALKALKGLGYTGDDTGK